MGRSLLIIISLFILLPLTVLHAQTWLWAKEAIPGGEGDTWADHCIAADVAGNAYFVGDFDGKLTFGTQILNTAYFNAFIVKYDKNGNALWARQNTNTTNNNDYGWATSVATDKAGNAYVTGYFIGTFTFGTHTINSSSKNVFLVKYNPAGTAVWAACSQSSSASTATGVSVATDNKCNVYVTGNFSDTVSFGTHTLMNSNVFLVKYDSAGHIIWAKQSSNSGGGVVSLATDGDKNIYLTGAYSNPFTFGSLTFTDPTGIYLARFDSSGTPIWEEDATGNFTIASVAVESTGDPYITGTVYGNTNFGSHPLIDPEPNYTAFLAKYDTLGNNMWAELGLNIDGNSWNGFSLACDSLKSGGCYLTMYTYGGGNGRIVFGQNTFKLATPTSYVSESALIQFDSAGKPLCGSVFTEGQEDDGDGIATDRSGRFIYMGADAFDPMVLGTDTLPYATGTVDIPFVARWVSCTDSTFGEGVSNISNQIPSFSVFPNPGAGNFFLQVESNKVELKSIEVFNVLGEKVYSNYQITKSSNYQIDLSSQPDGVYLYRAIAENGTLLGSGKLIIEK